MLEIHLEPKRNTEGGQTSGGGDFAFDALFTYDALGRRLSKDAISITCWLWNGNVPLHEWTSSQRRNENGEIEENQKDLRTWLFEEESFVPLALFQDGKAYSIVTDHLGTPVEAYNEQGEEVWYRRLDMNGKVIEERSMLYTSYKDYIKIPFLFQGQYYDGEVKLAYNSFRYYDPELGRYISEDPIRFASGATALHSYVEDSNTWTDTFGLRAGNTSFLPSELHPGTISAKNPGGIYRIPASGNYHDDKVALYAKAGLSEPFSPDYIAHHIVTILTQIQWKCNLFEAKAIRNYHIEDVLKIMKNKLKNASKIVMLNNSFIDKITNKKVIGRKISYENIVLFFCEWEFPGKDEYMEFLLQSNGLFFPDGLILKSNLDVELEVETLYDVNGRLERYWDIAKKNPDLPDDFTTRHIPIGNDAAGNQYWVDLFSGKILFFETEYDFPEGLHVVSDCFCTFYSNLRPM